MNQNGNLTAVFTYLASDSSLNYAVRTYTIYWFPQTSSLYYQPFLPNISSFHLFLPITSQHTSISSLHNTLPSHPSHPSLAPSSYHHPPSLSANCFAWFWGGEYISLNPTQVSFIFSSQPNIDLCFFTNQTKMFCVRVQSTYFTPPQRDDSYTWASAVSSGCVPGPSLVEE